MSVYLGSTLVNIAGQAPLAPAWVRPTDWLTMPDPSGTGGQFIGLLAIYSGGSNFIALSASPAYRVDWGDGTSAYYTSNAQANYHHSYDSLSTGSNCSGGYRQALIIVSPSGSGNLTAISLQKKHTQAGLPSIPLSTWLDIAISGNSITPTIGGSTTYLRMLERANLIRISPSISNFSSMFTTCSSLASVPLFDTSAGTNFSSMFINCYSLASVPLFDTSSGSNFSSMFSTCSSLTSVPLFDTSAGTNFSSMFTNCYSLASVPLFDTSSGSNFSSMFYNCSSLASVPLFDTSAGTNFSSMFYYCSSLASVPLFDTSAGTNFSSMFTYCSSLASVPLFDTSAGTNFSSMFTNCYSLASVPLFDTSSGSNFSSMFYYCYSLASVPLFDTSAGSNFSSMFYYCYSLASVPLFDTSAAITGAAFATTFSSAANIKNAAFSGTSRAIDYSNLSLSSSAILDIFNYLGSPTGTGQQINVSLNWGTASLTSGDLAVASGKNWQVRIS